MNIDNILKSLKFSAFNAANFMGRASRKEYWTYVLAAVATSIAFLIVSIVCIFVAPGVFAALLGLVSYPLYLGLLVPGIALGIRRMHDIGKTGWLALLPLVPFIGWIAFVILALQPSSASNKWGDGPLEITEINDFATLQFNFENI